MNTDIAFAGVDDGFFSIKVFTGDHSISIPARAAKGITLVDSSDSSDGFIFITDSGDFFTVDDHVPGALDTRTLATEYALSDVNRVLVHAALIRAGLAGKNCHIATGLPVSNYYLASTQKNNTLIESKKNNLGKAVACGVSGSQPVSTITRNEVCSEAIAAYIDMLIDVTGKPSEFAATLQSGITAVVDIGGQTTDCAVIMPGMKINMQRSGSSEVGVLYFYDDIRTELAGKFNLAVNNITKRQIELAIASGAISLFREKHDVKDIIGKCKERLFEKIRIAINDHVGNDVDIETLIFVGGGAIVFEEEIKQAYKGVIIPEEPEFANARGMYKMIKYIAGNANNGG